jgi:hypothetical protein
LSIQTTKIAEILISATDNHGETRRGWHPHPIIAVVIRNRWRKILRLKQDFTIKHNTEEFNKLTIKQKRKYTPVKIRGNP